MAKKQELQYRQSIVAPRGKMKLIEHRDGTLMAKGKECIKAADMLTSLVIRRSKSCLFAKPRPRIKPHNHAPMFLPRIGHCVWLGVKFLH